MVEIHNKQFLFAKAEVKNPFFEHWNTKKIGEYTLYSHANLSVALGKEQGDDRLLLLGNCYDYRYPDYSNQQIADHLGSIDSWHELLKEYSETSGENVLLFTKGSQIFLANDACSQMEVFYNQDVSLVASQPKLMERIVPLEEVTDLIARKHFDSQVFKNKKTNIGIETQFIGINHLIGNHYLDFEQRSQKRFYPNQKLSRISVAESAEKTKKILTGYLKSIANRSKVALPVTAGIDSRVILTCALDANIKNLEFFTIKFPWMTDTHNDLVISRMIAKRLNFQLDIYDISTTKPPVVPEFDESLTLHNTQFDTSTIHVLKQFGDRNVTVVDGSIIGVTKNFFGKLIRISGRNLARMAGYPNSEFAIRQFDRWLSKSKEIFDKHGFHTLDMFFWEDRASNWMLTVKTKFLLVSNYYSIFNSRALFESMLMTKRKYRDAQDHKIFNYILENAQHDLTNIPINPSIKKKIMLLGKKTGLYFLYRNIMIKLGILKFK